MTTNEKRISTLEAALKEVCTLLQRSDLTDTERKNLTREGNDLTAKIEELAA